VQRKINVRLTSTDKIGECGQQLIFTAFNIDFKKDGGRGGPAGFELLQAPGLGVPRLIGLRKKTARHRIAGPVLGAHNQFPRLASDRDRVNDNWRQVVVRFRRYFKGSEGYWIWLKPDNLTGARCGVEYGRPDPRTDINMDGGGVEKVVEERECLRFPLARRKTVPELGMGVRHMKNLALAINLTKGSRTVLGGGHGLVICGATLKVTAGPLPSNMRRVTAPGAMVETGNPPVN